MIMSEKKVAEKKVAEKKVAEKKVAEKKVAEKKVAEKKVAEKKVAKKKVAKKKVAKKKVEDKIIINPLEHIYVPNHEIVSEKEKQELSKLYNARPNQFPQILLSDPVIREIGAKPGDMIKITRESQTAGVTEYYRYVVM